MASNSAFGLRCRYSLQRVVPVRIRVEVPLDGARATATVPTTASSASPLPSATSVVAVATDRECRSPQDARRPLGAYTDIGIVNYGALLVGSGIVANGAGYLVGEGTTGSELGRIKDALGYVEA